VKESKECTDPPPGTSEMEEREEVQERKRECPESGGIRTEAI